jgi:hypothetical protein
MKIKNILKKIKNLAGFGPMLDSEPILRMIEKPKKQTKNRRIWGLNSHHDLEVNHSRSANHVLRWKRCYSLNLNGYRSNNGEVAFRYLLVNYGKTVSSKEVLIDFDQKEIRPAEKHELLAFAIRYFGFQRKYSITALGTVQQLESGFKSVTCLWRNNNGQPSKSGYGCFDGEWHENFWFLAISEHKT